MIRLITVLNFLQCQVHNSISLSLCLPTFQTIGQITARIATANMRDDEAETLMHADTCTWLLVAVQAFFIAVSFSLRYDGDAILSIWVI